MTKQTTIKISMEAKTKRQLKQLAKDLGLTPSSLINAQVKQLIRNHQLPLTTAYPTAEVDAKTAKHLDQVLKQVEAGQNIVGPFNDIDSFIASLESDRSKD